MDNALFRAAASVEQKADRPHLVSRILLAILPQVLTLAVSIVLFVNLGTGSKFDAQTWPLEAGTGRITDLSKVADGIGIYRLFVFATASLVLLNNLMIYNSEIGKASEAANHVSTHGRWARSSARTLAWFANIFIAFWLLDVVLALAPLRSLKNEFASLGLFGAFALIDSMLSASCKAQMQVASDKESRSVLAREAEYYRAQAFFVDLPVIIGMFTVLIATGLLQGHHGYTSGFENGFQSGAVGMHLAYSQFVFLTLTLRHYRSLYRDWQLTRTEKTRSGK